ncbi:MAG: Gfo/Idh/MocA family protein [Planctomycetota bacterium]
MQHSKISRRHLLKGGIRTLAGAMAAPYAITSTALGSAGRTAASERITLACIGVGSHGTEMNLKTFLGCSDAQVVAVCDVDSRYLRRAERIVNKHYAENTTSRIFDSCDTTRDFREIIARDDIDAVVISTPDHWHALMSVMAARAGKDVFCEKPTLTVQEGRVLSDTMKRYGRVFQTASESRAVHVYHRMCELVRNGRIGKIHTVHVGLRSGPRRPGDPTPMPVPKELDYEMWLGPAPWKPYTKDRLHYEWRWILDYSGGQLTDWGAHLVNIAQWGNDTELTGPIEVQGTGTFASEGLYNTATQYRIEYKYASGTNLIISSTEPSLRFEGSDGWIGNTGWRGRLQAEPASVLDSVIGPEEIHLYTCPEGEQRNFLDCVRSRRPCYYPAEIGHRVFTITHIGNIAMMLGKKLRWDPDAERFIGDDQANKMLSRSMRSPWRL